jgi:hypothetical protein
VSFREVAVEYPDVVRKLDFDTLECNYEHFDVKSPEFVSRKRPRSPSISDLD